MMSLFQPDQSRRAFLKRSATLGVAGVAAPFVTSLAGIGEAAAATASDYKAMVCVFLYGGNDYANTLPPYDAAGYAQYAAARSALAIPREKLAATALTPVGGVIGGRQYALAPTMTSLVPVWAAGKLAVALNVGTLIQPTTKAQFRGRSVQLPPKLMSHNDQQSFFQASGPEGAASGWGGRIGDLFQAGNGAATLTCVNASGNAVFLTGRTAFQYAVGTNGPVPLLGNGAKVYGSTAAMGALRTLMGGSVPNMIGNEHATISKRALDAYQQVASALAGAPAANFPLFPSGNPLADQLRMVARTISVAPALGVKRQVFFVSMGNFDHHDNLAGKHPALIGAVADAMRAFYDTTVQLGVSEQVTAFTGSDFGRTLSSNDDGSDHGWGGMHFVMGGAVKGQRLYGTPPEIGSDTDSDIGQGRLLPTTSVDQYAATLASWFGVSGGDMRTVLPNAGNYDQSSLNLGFV